MTAVLLFASGACLGYWLAYRKVQAAMRQAALAAFELMAEEVIKEATKQQAESQERKAEAVSQLLQANWRQMRVH